MTRKLVITGLAVVLCTSTAVGMKDNKQPTLVEKNQQLRKQLKKERNELERLRTIAAPILHPTPEGNKRLNAAYFGSEASCSAKIIEGETAGTWDHTIWNYSGSGAYGLGQARPRDKMAKYSYAGLHAYTNPMPQLIWMEDYANQRFGGICNAAAQWSYARSW
jgi:hypothetical protein